MDCMPLNPLKGTFFGSIVETIFCNTFIFVDIINDGNFPFQGRNPIGRGVVKISSTRHAENVGRGLKNDPTFC